MQFLEYKKAGKNIGFDIVEWCGSFNGCSTPANFKTFIFGNICLRKYCGVSKYFNKVESNTESDSLRAESR